MHATHQQPRTSPLASALRWLRNFEQAMEMRPVDYLELRVAALETQLAARVESPREAPTRLLHASEG